MPRNFEFFGVFGLEDLDGQPERFLSAGKMHVSRCSVSAVPRDK